MILADDDDVCVCVCFFLCDFILQLSYLFLFRQRFFYIFFSLLSSVFLSPLSESFATPFLQRSVRKAFNVKTLYVSVLCSAAGNIEKEERNEEEKKNVIQNETAEKRNQRKKKKHKRFSIEMCIRISFSDKPNRKSRRTRHK